MALGSTAKNDPSHFVTSTGWDVQLEEACIAVGPIYFYANTAFASAETGRWNRIKSVVGIEKQAFAHAGHNHFNGGEVRAEWLGQNALNVLNPTLDPLGLQNGLWGEVKSFSVYLEPPRKLLAANPCLRGHNAFARGIARKAERVVPFEGGLDIENVGVNRRVEGLKYSATFDDGVGVAISAQPNAWFDQADFDTLDTMTTEGRFVITPNSQVRVAWFIGARGIGSFRAAALQ